jgi:hypothetical protein
MTIHWSLENGFAHVTPDTSVALLCDAAAARGCHVGVLGWHAPTVGGALTAQEPWLMRQLMRCVLEGPDGRVTPPLAPRAAVGPDVALLGVLNPAHVVELTVRLEAVQAWVEQRSDSLDTALQEARALGERGVSLVEVDAVEGAWRMVAALPRVLPSLGRWGRTSPRAHPVPTAPVKTPWNRAAGAHRVALLDAHLCAAWGVHAPVRDAAVVALEAALAAAEAPGV